MQMISKLCSTPSVLQNDYCSVENRSASQPSDFTEEILNQEATKTKKWNALSSTRCQNPALPPDICAFGDSFAIVFGEADPPERVTTRKHPCPRHKRIISCIRPTKEGPE